MCRFLLILTLASFLTLRISRSDTPTAAQQRLAAAAELQRFFDASLVKNMELKFLVRGDHCDVLNVEAWNLYDTMMNALAHGDVLYGKILPGGVNKFAFSHGFRNVVYTNRDDHIFAAFGPSSYTRAQALKLRKCDVAIARSITAESPAPVATPPFEPHVRTTATPKEDPLLDAMAKDPRIDQGVKVSLAFTLMHPDVGDDGLSFFRSPKVVDHLSARGPVLRALVPNDSWAQMSQSDKAAYTAYVKWLAGDASKRPEHYQPGIDPNSLDWPRFLDLTRKMSADSWEIMICKKNVSGKWVPDKAALRGK